MKDAIYWFRNDLRLEDNPSLRFACQESRSIIFVYCHDQTDAPSAWGFQRIGIHRRVFLSQCLASLRQALASTGHTLLEYDGPPERTLPELAKILNTGVIFTESIEAPDELETVRVLRELGLEVNLTWQSSLLHPDDLPFDCSDLPDVFTRFRHQVEADGVQPRMPEAAPATFPRPLLLNSRPDFQVEESEIRAEPRSSFPYHTPACAGGETAARFHLRRYFERRLADRYKVTRNELLGLDFSTKFSPWLALGTVSARMIFASLSRYEGTFGRNDGTYWIWFELLWRDYFRFLHIKYGTKLYRSKGLLGHAALPHDEAAYRAWCHGQTGQKLIDAGMRELSSTGYLSNRMRQIVASYLIHDLDVDWRAGAAWFESHLIDYDVYSNQGNWLYIAGYGTDPRGGRHFDPEQQAKTYDPLGVYQSSWLESLPKREQMNEQEAPP